MNAAAFIAGWYRGLMEGEKSIAQAEQINPGYDHQQLDAYCQGTVDGNIGDKFRLRRCEEAIRGEDAWHGLTGE